MGNENYTLIKNLIDAYVGSSENPESSFNPDFIYNSNDKENPRKVFDTLKDNLENCEEFMFSVAFINDSGLNLFKQIFIELKERNPQIKGRIITSNYLSFTEPKALKQLLEYDNIDVRMYYINEGDKVGFHTKGYIFKYRNDQYKVVIGSSNITQSALTSNNEWNNLIVSTGDGEIMKNILPEFERMWDKSSPLKDVLDKYEEEYNKQEILRKVDENSETKYKIVAKPNAMQLQFIKRLNESIENGDSRGLLISATGTGKTYASAFGVKSIQNFEINKLLFVTHRETILKQAIETYKNVFGNSIKTALYSGSNHNLGDANFIFSTISTIGKDKYLKEFKEDEYDFVIIDECHRIGEKTMYQNVLNYFKPKYLLGMSATPDRSSDNYDVYGVFNHNILYEIRLNDALEANMLVPFHYFGISDLEVDGKCIDDETTFKYLTSEERVKHILEKSRYYGYSGKRRKCLMFVSNRDEGKELARKINEQGVKCAYLDGETNQADREKAIDLLEEDNLNKDYLEIIITIDIFNEGVDIPSVNQVIFLRPTKSSIIFIQQLGRGLRLNYGKEYLTLIDFIANYKNNYLIPETFSTKGSGKKRGERAVHPLTPGCSVVQFDQISKKRIIEAFAKIPNTNNRRIKDQYLDIKNRLGRVPTLIEFDDGGIISGRVFLDFGSSLGSYYDFLLNMKDEKEVLSQEEKDTIKYLSMSIGSGLRIHEALLLKNLLMSNVEEDFIYDLNKNGSYIFDDDVKKSMLSVLDTSFYKTVTTKTKEFAICELENNKFVLTGKFKEAYKNHTFRKYVDQIIDYALYSQKRYFHKFNDSKNNLVLYEKYTRKDVCWLINNKKNESSTMYGYKCFDDLKILPLFVTYQKSVDEDSSINYADRFINKFIFSWDSRSNRTLKSKEIQNVIKFLTTKEYKTLLFVKRNDVINKSELEENSGTKEIDKDGSFYFLGEVGLLDNPREEQIGKTKKTDVVRFLLSLKTPVKDEIYDYLIEKPLVVDDKTK